MITTLLLSSVKVMVEEVVKVVVVVMDGRGSSDGW